MFILTAGDETVGVFGSLESAIQAHAACNANNDSPFYSRWLRWFICKTQIDSVLENANDWKPFAWGELLITDENRNDVLKNWS